MIERLWPLFKESAEPYRAVLESDGVYLAVLILAAYWAVLSVSGGLDRRRGRAKGPVYVWVVSFLAAALVSASCLWRLL
jgi:hypothetical protein